MDIALLSGADKNAGDFLIVGRTRRLLEALLDGCTIHEFARNKSLDPVLDEVNACDYVVFAGGPGYVVSMYPERFPLTEDLSDIRPRMFALGMGCYTSKPMAAPIPFSSSSRKLLDRLCSDGFGLGCRDELTAQSLRASGISDVRMTGCPAWYDLGCVDAVEPALAPLCNKVSRIAVSDPGNMDNFKTAKKLVDELDRRFSGAEISFVFHRGWECDEFTYGTLARSQQRLRAWLERRGISCIDISYGEQGFSIYDECDVHIGFRVHAHIYCLSRRRLSFLIEEDARGFGINDALGLEHFGLQRSPLVGIVQGGARHRLKLDLDLTARRDARIIENFVAAAVSEMDASYPSLREAYARMGRSFETMRRHVLQMAA